MTRHLAFLLVLAACSDGSGPSVQLVPASFQLVSGAEQIDTVAQELTEMIALQVIASDGITPVPSYPISWTALDGGQVFASVVNSGSDGVVRQRFTLGTQAWADADVPGTPDPARGRMRYRMVARALHPETGALLVDDTVSAYGRPDIAVTVRLSDGLGHVNDSTLVVIDLRDQFNNALAPCPSGAALGPVTWWSGDSSIALPTGHLHWSIFNGDSLAYGWVRGVSTGTTTVGVTVLCMSKTVSASYQVMP